jgi:hypothetical protein
MSEQMGAADGWCYAVRNELALPDAPRFLHVHHGWLRRRTHRLPVAARTLLHDCGVVVDGPAAQSIFVPVPQALLHEEMLFNLNTYWARKADRPWLFLADTAADFAVTTLPRIINTLDHGTIISKQQALMLLEEQFPEWRKLSNDVRSRSMGTLRFPLSGPARARKVAAFLRSMIAYGNNLNISSFQRPVTSSPTYIVS